MDRIIVLLVGVCIVFVLAIVFSAIWVYKDAKSRGLPAGLWAFFVVISGNFIGLILYILIARKQEVIVCGHCNMQTGRGAFCSKCGNALTQADLAVNRGKPKSGRGLLIACVACIALGFVLIAILVVSVVFPREGFKYVSSSSSYRYKIAGGATARGLRERSSGDTWEISFREASAGYTFTNTFVADSQLSRLEFDLNYSGFVQLKVSQGDALINEVLTEGFYEYDLSGFNVGRINIELINIQDGGDYSGVLTVFRESR